MKETTPVKEVRRLLDAGVTTLFVYNLIVGALGSAYSLISDSAFFLKPLITLDIPIVVHPLWHPIIICFFYWWLVFICVRYVCSLEWVRVPIIIMDCVKLGWLVIFCFPRVIFVWVLRWVCRWVVVFVHVPIIICVISHVIIAYR